ncbi:unnamed protein product [Urochloa humidicola]
MGGAPPLPISAGTEVGQGTAVPHRSWDRRGDARRSRGGWVETQATFVAAQICVLDVAEKLSVARFCRWYSCNPADLFHALVRKSVPQWA